MPNWKEHPPGSEKSTELQEIEPQGNAFREDLERAAETLILKSEALSAQDLTWYVYERVIDRLY